MSKRRWLCCVLAIELVAALTVGRPAVVTMERIEASRAYRNDPSDANRRQLDAARWQHERIKIVGSLVVFVVMAVPTTILFLIVRSVRNRQRAHGNPPGATG